MTVLLFRTLILYITVVASVRIMGKRQIGEMQPSELVVAIMISDLASVPMQSVDIPLIAGVVPVLALVIFEVFLSYIILKSKSLRRIITGEPSIVVYNGHINESELKKQRFNLNDLLEQIRINGYSNIADVSVAVLETNGQLSIIPKREARNVTVSDMNLKNAKTEILPYMLISDGELNKPELLRSGKSESWLKSELKKRKIKDYKEVFVASYDDVGGFFIQKKEKKR